MEANTETKPDQEKFFLLQVTDTSGHRTLSLDVAEAVEFITSEMKGRGKMLYVEGSYVPPNMVSAAVASGKSGQLVNALRGGSETQSQLVAENPLGPIAANIAYRSLLRECETTKERLEALSSRFGASLTKSEVASVSDALSKKRTKPVRAVTMDVNPDESAKRVAAIAKIGDRRVRRIFTITALFDGDSRAASGYTIYQYCDRVGLRGSYASIKNAVENAKREVAAKSGRKRQPSSKKKARGKRT